MAECTKCGTQTSMPFTCKFCEHTFCSKHRLPENHDCGGLEAYKEQSQESGTIGYTVSTTTVSDTVDDSRDRDRLRSPFLESLKTVFPASATYVFLGAIILTFLWQLQHGLQSSITLLGARSGITLQEPWRLVTSMFLHAGLGHLLVNSIVLASFGPALERMIGSRSFAKIMLIAGIASSAGFAAWSTFFNPDALAVGLSGALYGLVTILAVLRPDIRVLAFFIIPLKIRTAIIIFATIDTLNLVTHALGMPLPVISLFASAGHLSGFLIGLFFARQLRRQYDFRRTRTRIGL